MKTDPPLGSSQKGLPAQTLVSVGGERIPPMGISVVVEIQTTSMEESWCRWVKDFPCKGRALSLGASLVLHLWEVESTREKPQARRNREKECKIVLDGSK
jgi:hypothetical protein